MFHHAATYPINTPVMNVMTAAARKAAKGLVRDFSEIGHLQVSRKGAMNFVSDADVRSERILKEMLQKARPDYGFLMEESGEIIGKKSEYRWIVDPLDGTTNFLHAVPYFAISIGLEKISDGKPELVAGVVYDPIHDEMFLAEKGKGAFVNDMRLRVSMRENSFYFVTGTARMQTPYSPRTSILSRYAGEEVECVLRRSGSAAMDLAYVAAGRYDATWFAHLNAWDMAAGIVLVREAGGEVEMIGEQYGDYYGTGCILAGTKEALNALRPATMSMKV